MRQNWDHFFLTMARTMAEQSTCNRAKVGCVLVRDKRILTAGFNGSPKSQEHCDDVGHLVVDNHCIRTIHAEMNAIIQAALHGISTDGAICYVTHLPCIICTKMLINAGISKIVFENLYRPDPYALSFLEKANIKLVRIEVI